MMSFQSDVNTEWRGPMRALERAVASDGIAIVKDVPKR